MGGNESLNYSAVNRVNMAADGNIVCPQCGTMNGVGARFCKTCGYNLAEFVQDQKREQAAFPVTKTGGMNRVSGTTEQGKSAFPVKNTQIPVYAAKQQIAATAEIQESEPVSVFAEGLPGWNIEPPQVVVRRKRSK